MRTAVRPSSVPVTTNSRWCTLGCMWPHFHRSQQKNPDRSQGSQVHQMGMNPNPSGDNKDDASGGTAAEAATSLGTTQNVAGLLAYILGWVTGIVFLIIEKENNFVRFHAMQSIVIFVPLMIASVVVGFLPIVGDALSTIVGLATLSIWLFMMYQAFQGKLCKFPYAGDFAESQLRNTGTT